MSFVLADESEDPNKAAFNAAAKRKGSFKKWLRSSHRKLTSNSAQRAAAANAKELNGGQKLTDLENLKIKKVLSNSEDLKIKNWLVEESEGAEGSNTSMDQV